MSTDPTGTASPTRKGCSIVWGLALLIAASCTLFAISAPKLGYFSSPGQGNETAAIGALRTLCNAQTLFHDHDKAHDGVDHYGTLAELSHRGLIDPVLGGGEKQGYTFVCQPVARSSGESRWFASASPTVPLTTGRRYFAINQAGAIYDSTTGPIEIDPTTCAISTDVNVRPLGR